MLKWKWDRTPKLEKKKPVRVIIEWDDGTKNEYPRDFANKEGEIGKFGESGKAKLAVIYLGAWDGEDYVSIYRGPVDELTLRIIQRDLEEWI